jgi:hypothetical protein
MNKSPEPIILTVALVLLALCAAGLALYYPSVEDITGVKTTTPSTQRVTAINADDNKAKLTLWDTPELWTEPSSRNRLFQADEYLFFPGAYPNGDYIKKVNEKTISPSGVLLSWYRKNHLDFTDPGVDREDPDGDGFSNIVEYKNDPIGVRQKTADCDGTKSTNPQDANSHPDYLARLRLAQYETRAFHIQFTGYQQLNGVYVFQLRLKDVPSYNQPPLLKTGDKLGFEGYIIGAFHQSFDDIKDPATGAVVHTDTSTLELDKPDIDLSVSVPFRQEIDSPESTADFVMLMPNDVDKIIKISRGKVFSILPYLPDVSYLVIKAGDSGAVIRDIKTKQDYNILKLDPAEWNEVPVKSP